MLDIKFIRENPEIVKENIRKKFQEAKLPLVDEVIALDAQRRAAIAEVEQADIFVIIGSSLNVYPAAGLVHYVPAGAPIYLIDPKEVQVPAHRAVEVIQAVASDGCEQLRRAIAALP